MRYEPNIIAEPTELSTRDLVEYVQSELRRVAEYTQTVDEGRIEVLHTEPTRPRAGQLVYADGADWDPGQGVGYYFYDGTEWVWLCSTSGSDLYPYHLFGGL